MEPKFQSSFIPKGPLATQNTVGVKGLKKHKSFFGFIVGMVFTLVILISLGMVGYVQFLKYRISKMATDLEAARQAIDPEIINSLTRTDARIKGTQELLTKHVAMTPLFEFLETSTLRSVRFTGFAYDTAGDNIEISMKGQARGYAALALQADAISKNQNFKDPIFSDLTLDDVGNVAFTFKAFVEPALTSYKRDLEKSLLPTTSAPVSVPSATSTGTTTRP